jgi:hypothetical protein
MKTARTRASTRPEDPRAPDEVRLAAGWCQEFYVLPVDGLGAQSVNRSDARVEGHQAAPGAAGCWRQIGVTSDEDYGPSVILMHWVCPIGTRR